MRIIDRTTDHLDEPVHCCPGWTGRDLLRHVGMTPAIWATIMNTAPGEGFPKLDMDRIAAEVPADDEGLGPWARAETVRYADSLRKRDPDSWAFNMGPNTTAWMWMRRAAAETAVHLWDAESLAGLPSVVPTNLAADGLDELTEMVANLLARTTSAVPTPVKVVATDIGGAWIFASPATSDEAAMVEGAAGQLFLRLWGRPTSGLSGATSLLDEWARLPFASPPPPTDSLP
jgi:uncharacterized protein (TIGR03083 family)